MDAIGDSPQPYVTIIPYKLSVITLLLAVVVLNVLGFYNPLRELIRNAVRDEFIRPSNERLIVFVDGPSDHSKHEEFDWGTAAIDALEQWSDEAGILEYDWTLRLADGRQSRGDVLDAV